MPRFRSHLQHFAHRWAPRLAQLCRVGCVCLLAFVVYGCSQYNGYRRMAWNFLESYTQPVRWDEGIDAIRADIQAYADQSRGDNYLWRYLMRQGADACKTTVAFESRQFALGYFENMGARESYCARGGIGLYMTFRTIGSREVVLENLDIFESYTTVREADLKRAAARAIREIPPMSLFDNNVTKLSEKTNRKGENTVF